jgi:acyl-coenzyme A thioesterase PaaI-like protein
MSNEEPTDRPPTAPPTAVLQELERRWNEHPGIRRIGARLDLSEPGQIRAVVDPIEPHHRGGMGTAAVNGPTIAAVFDLVTGLTGYLQALGRRVGVAQLNIQFLRPVNGKRFHAIGRPVRVGHTLVFVAGELYDGAGVLCATSDGLVSVSQVEATGELAL